MDSFVVYSLLLKNEHRQRIKGKETLWLAYNSLAKYMLVTFIKFCSCKDILYLTYIHEQKKSKCLFSKVIKNIYSPPYQISAIHIAKTILNYIFG